METIVLIEEETSIAGMVLYALRSEGIARLKSLLSPIVCSAILIPFVLPGLVGARSRGR
jgi:hypothetical protein